MTIIRPFRECVHEKYLCSLMYKYSFVNACIICTNLKDY